MKKIIIAHRGAPNFSKENTMESFEKAVALGADMIEFDVRETRDHVFVVYHDGLIQNESIRELTYHAIHQMAKGEGFDLPTVEEVLQWAKGKVKLDIELKEEGYEEAFLALLSKYLQADQFIITSFHDPSLKKIKDHSPHLHVGLILGRFRKPFYFKFSEFFPMRRYQEAKADFLIVHWQLLRFGFLERAQRNQIPVFVWAVNEEERMWKLLHDERICALITDHPDLAVSLRSKMEGS